MYTPDSQVDRKCLRQGDILTAVPFPIIDIGSAVLGRIDAEAGFQIPHPKIPTIPREHRNQDDCFTMQVATRLAPCTVIAHCCELELRNGKCLLPMISVARILPVKVSISRDTEKLASLRANKDPRSSEDPGYLDYFYLEPHKSIGGIECVVDFSQIAPVPGTEYQNLLRRKALQLLDRERVKFKIKLAAFLARLTDEEVAADLVNPWLPR